MNEERIARMEENFNRLRQEIDKKLQQHHPTSIIKQNTDITDKQITNFREWLIKRDIKLQLI